MRLPRLRFTVRRLMLVVAIVAALLTAFEAGRRWERVHRQRGALRVRTVGHVGPWRLANPANAAGASPTNDYLQE
jgi:hypothetical protein